MRNFLLLHRKALIVLLYKEGTKDQWQIGIGDWVQTDDWDWYEVYDYCWSEDEFILRVAADGDYSNTEWLFMDDIQAVRPLSKKKTLL